MTQEAKNQRNLFASPADMIILQIPRVTNTTEMTNIERDHRKVQNMLELADNNMDSQGRPTYNSRIQLLIDPTTLANIVAKEISHRYRDQRDYHCDSLDMDLMMNDGHQVNMRFDFVVEWTKRGKPAMFRWEPMNAFRVHGKPVAWEMTASENFNNLVVNYIEYYDRQQDNQ